MLIFASDYDNTLFFKDGVREKDIEMIHELRKTGAKFGIVSGRAISSIQHELKKYEIPFDFIIGVNGGFIVDQDYEEIYGSYITIDSAKEIRDFFHNHKPSSYTMHDGYRLARKIFDKDFNLGIEATWTDEETLLNSKVSGFFTHFNTEEEANHCANLINSQFNTVLAQQNSNFLDITAPGVNKAYGIEMLVKHKGWDMPVWTIGDAQNDQLMIESFNSFALSHGDKTLQKSADYVVDSVAEAILQLLA